MKLKIDNFIVAISVVVVFAYFFPHLGGNHSFLPINLLSSIGVSLIFFFYGLKLSPEKIKNGLRNWQLHVLIQLSTFLLFPLLIIAFYPLTKTPQAHNIWLGFLFLAALPSTVSSSVVMVSIAKGNVPAAIFNASISGLIGIVITPLWMGIFLEKSSGDFHLSTIYIKLLSEIVLPVFIGLMLQKYLGKYALKYNSYLTTFDKSVILLIIFKSFAVSFEEGIFSTVRVFDLCIITIAVLILFYFVYFLTRYLATKLGFNRGDSIAAQFCGTKKSLVHGTVFSKIVLPATLPIGIVLLPLMLFHAIQLFIISVVATKYGKEFPSEKELK